MFAIPTRYHLRVLHQSIIYKYVYVFVVFFLNFLFFFLTPFTTQYQRNETTAWNDAMACDEQLRVTYLKQKWGKKNINKTILKQYIRAYCTYYNNMYVCRHAAVSSATKFYLTVARKNHIIISSAVQKHR